MKLCNVIGFSAVLLIAAALPAPAQTVTCGMVITTPGTYTISGSLSCSAPSDGVQVNTSNVTIQFANNGYLSCAGCPTSGGTETGIRVYDPAGGPLSNIKILGSGVIDGYPFAISFAGVKDSQVSGMVWLYGGLHLSLNDDANGDHCQHDLFTGNTTYSGLTGDIIGTVYDSTFIGNTLLGTANGGFGAGIQILNGDNNQLIGNSLTSFLVGIELGGVGSTGARGNIVTGNRMTGNITGLLVTPPANRNRFEANFIFGNSTFDVNEGNSSCGTDVYTRDIVGTTNQSCVH